MVGDSIRMSDNKLGFSVFCLVGGFGTRVKHVLDGVPKPLAAVAGKPFLHWLMLNLKKNGAKRCFLLTHHKHKCFEKFVSQQSDEFFKISCIKEQTPEGTGGSLLSAIKKSGIDDEVFVVMNGDTFVDIEFSKIFQMWSSNLDAIIVGKYVKNTERYGSLNFSSRTKLLKGFKEKIVGEGFINTGIIITNASFFGGLETYERPLSLEHKILPNAISSRKRILVFETDGEFIDIGTEKSYFSASKFISNLFSTNQNRKESDAV